MHSDPIPEACFSFCFFWLLHGPTSTIIQPQIGRVDEELEWRPRFSRICTSSLQSNRKPCRASLGCVVKTVLVWLMAGSCPGCEALGFWEIHQSYCTVFDIPTLARNSERVWNTTTRGWTSGEYGMFGASVPWVSFSHIRFFFRYEMILRCHVPQQLSRTPTFYEHMNIIQQLMMLQDMSLKA